MKKHPLLTALSILIGIIILIFSVRLLPALIRVILPIIGVYLFYYILRRFVLKGPRPTHRGEFSASSGSANSGPTENSGPAGVPPRPAPAPASPDDRDYDIVIDSQTQEEYHIPRNKH